MNAYNFDIPSRQSVKGIIVIFGISAFRILKGSWVFVLLIVLKYLQSGKGPDLSHPIFISSAIALLLFILIIAVLQFLNFKFFLRDGYFFLSKGILNKEEISVSLSKIQNVYVKQNLLQQIINVVSLSIETAGDDKTEITITALSRPKALALKSQLMYRRSLKELCDDETVTEQVYFKASLVRLLLEGLSENHLKSFALILAFLAGLYNDLKEFVNTVGFMERFKDRFQMDGESLMAVALLNLTFLSVLLILSLLFSMIKVLIQNYDLKVLRRDDGLEISKGLFNKISLSLSSSRMQKTTISTNRLKRALGLYKLSFTQANSNKKQQGNFNIVAINKKQVSELLEQFYPNIHSRISKNKPHKYLMYRLLYIGFFIVLMINIGLFFLPSVFLLVNILLVLLVIGNAWFSYRKCFYYVDKDYIVRGGGGLIDSWTSFLELHKTQSIQIKQSIFQKRRGLTSMIIHSASRSMTIPHITRAEALDLCNGILYLVESQNKDWM